MCGVGWGGVCWKKIRDRHFIDAVRRGYRLRVCMEVWGWVVLCWIRLGGVV